MPHTPREVADRQAAAYNAHDLEAFCALFAKDARLIDLPSGKVIADGLAEIRAFYAERFSNPELSCRVHAKIDLGDFALDRESIYGVPGAPLETLAAYEVKNGLIARVFFIRESR